MFLEKTYTHLKLESVDWDLKIRNHWAFKFVTSWKPLIFHLTTKEIKRVRRPETPLSFKADIAPFCIYKVCLYLACYIRTRNCQLESNLGHDILKVLYNFKFMISWEFIFVWAIFLTQVWWHTLLIPVL